MVTVGRPEVVAVEPVTEVFAVAAELELGPLLELPEVPSEVPPQPAIRKSVDRISRIFTCFIGG